LIFLL